MERYSEGTSKNKREVVLLKGTKCAWGKCAFCDYILDNSDDIDEINKINFATLDKVKGKYGSLEIINSGSVFELPRETLEYIKIIAEKQKITLLYFESHYMYKHRLSELRSFFPMPLIIKLGMETFDETFRNKILLKGIKYQNINEVSAYFDSLCLMVGIKGQTMAMIENDINLLTEHFKYGCINVFQNNSTNIKADPALIDWFKHKYGNMDNYPQIDVLYHITDFKVGELDE